MLERFTPEYFVLLCTLEWRYAAGCCGQSQHNMYIPISRLQANQVVRV